MPYDNIKDLSVRLCMLSALTLGTACGDDVVATSDGSTGGSTSDGTSPTSTSVTQGPTTDTTSTTAVDSSSSSGEDTTAADTTGDESTTMVDPTEASSSSSSSGDAESSSSSSSSTTGPLQLECPYGELMAPDLVAVNTAGEDSEFTNSCGGGGAPDASYTLTAPADGTYFITATSPDGVVDPLLAVYDGVCGGPELACNEDFEAGSSEARVSVGLMAGDTITVVVDGFSVVGGAVDLEVAFFEGTCPDGDAGSMVPNLITGTTMTGDNTTFGSCGGTTANEDQYTFIAPQDGIYTIDTLGSDFDTVLYALDSCGGTEIACNDNSVDSTSRLNLELVQDQEIVLVVDGFGLENGNYNLNIDFDQCPDADLGQTLPLTITGNTDFETNASQGSCGPGASNDVAYTFTAPAAGTYIFDTNGSDFDTVLYYFAGSTCEGMEIECDDDGGIGLDSQLIIPMEADEQITLIIDGRFGGSGDYVLNVQAPVCGNDMVETGEECDTDQLGGATCISEGFSGGTLACSDSCTLDVSGCDTCGNGTVEGTDACDGVALGSQNCQDLGFDGGALDCAGDCTYDTTQCANGIVAICSSPGSAIDSNLPAATDTITVPDMGTIADVDVFVDITHTFDGDLEMSLTADDLAITTNLSFDLCGSADDVFATFNDEGSATVGVDCVQPIGIEGNLTPQQPLSAFDGMASNGTWTLTVNDDAGGDVGTLNEWCVYITLE